VILTISEWKFIGAYWMCSGERIEPVGLFGLAPSLAANGAAPSPPCHAASRGADAIWVRPRRAGLGTETETLRVLWPPVAARHRLPSRSVVVGSLLLALWSRRFSIWLITKRYG
jgi:hypothetical protein